MPGTRRTKASMGGLSPSVNDKLGCCRLVVVGNPGSNRIAFLNEALLRRDLPPAVLVSWQAVLTGGASLAEILCPGDLLRIESPGRDAAVEAALVGIGREAEHGEIFFPRLWYEGFCRALALLEAQRSAAPEHRLLNDLHETATLFDKAETHRRFRNAGLPVPQSIQSIGPVRCLSELWESMKENRTRQAFVKLAHGSSASGAMAVRTDGAGNWRAYTTVERGDRGRLYNSRRIQVLDSPGEIDEVLTRLAPHTIHVEEWLPKASLGGCAFDLRALVIGGKLRHVVARLSRSPMTNLHLLNRRADEETVRAHVGKAAWDALTELAERAASVFPKSLHLGLDVMWLPGFRRLALLEANAFGDLLPGTLWDGKTTYDVELEEALGGC